MHPISHTKCKGFATVAFTLRIYHNFIIRTMMLNKIKSSAKLDFTLLFQFNFYPTYFLIPAEAASGFMLRIISI